MLKIKSPTNYNYATVKITQSRLNKGLIAIPVSLAKLFPDSITRLHVYLDDSPAPEVKTYSSYTSATRECRIGGMAEWFRRSKIKDGDEIVIQMIDKEQSIYRIIPEHNFIVKTHEIQKNLDNAKNETAAKEEIIHLSKWTGIENKKVVLSEFLRLTKDIPHEERRYINKRSNKARENVPFNLRTLLTEVYHGHCQVCDFWFLKKDNGPYFEIHHVNPLLSNNPRNLVIVCANCHRQFEYANVRQEFNNDNWLIKVHFNNKIYPVNQIILKTKIEESFKQLHT
ncbi:MAG: HNH endonuclease signature motif containing protein [Thermodesulfovibrionales bacterium]|nr:HNH endonuclease signature motif containing protein [Thermodesulfovibrionales bacterium]